MSLNQNLINSRDLPEIFKEICLQKLTGVLFAERLKYRRSVYFQEGAPIFAASNLSEDKLGKILFTQGKINMDQLMEALDKAKSERKRLGSVLVELGHIAAKDLFEAVVFQVQQIIFSLFEEEWREATFRFDENAKFGQEIIKLSIHPAEVILQGIRRSYDPDLIEKNVGDGSAVFAYTGDESFQIDKLSISPEERQAFIMLDGRASIDELVKETGAARYKVITLFYALKVLGIIESRSLAAAPRAGVLQETSAIDIDVEDLDPTEESLDLGDFDLPDEIVGGTSAQAATATAATPAPAAAPAAPRVPAAAAGTATAKPPAKRATPRTFSVEGLKTETARMRGVTFYERLGLGKEVSASAIVGAYTALKKKFSTDLPSTLRPAGKGALALVEDAYAALSLESSRRVYDATLAAGGSPQEVETRFRKEFAAVRSDEGRQAWEQSRLADAEKAFRQSVRLDPTKADYYWGLGLVLAAAEEGAPEFREVEGLFSKASALQSDQPRSYYYLGVVYQHRGETDRAIENFRKALELDVRYEPAREGLQACGADET